MDPVDDHHHLTITVGEKITVSRCFFYNTIQLYYSIIFNSNIGYKLKPKVVHKEHKPLGHYITLQEPNAFCTNFTHFLQRPPLFHFINTFFT